MAVITWFLSSVWTLVTLILVSCVICSVQEDGVEDPVTTTAYPQIFTREEQPGSIVESSNDRFRDSSEKNLTDDFDESETSDTEVELQRVPSKTSPNRRPHQPLLIKSNPVISGLPSQKIGGTASDVTNTNDRSKGPKPVLIKHKVGSAGENEKTPASSLPTAYNFQYGHFPPGSSTANVKTQLDQLFSKVHSFPQLTFVTSPLTSNDAFVQGVQYIKDAYFEMLENLREFRTAVSKRIEAIETEVQSLAAKVNETRAPLPVTLPDSIAAQLDNMIAQSWLLRMRELERVFNMSRLVDHCAHYIVGNHLEDALGIWSRLSDLTAGNDEQRQKNLLDLVKLAYARNNSNTSPVFRFLRRLESVDKIPVYDHLVNGMKSKDNFEGTEIFYIAQYLKERNAVRSSVYSKIPRTVQYAVSGRNVNIVFVGKSQERNYVHVRDDHSRERFNFYVQASQSYTDTRSAVWNFIFLPTTETFHIKNSLFGDYMFVNQEGFLETVPTNAALTPGAKFTFALLQNSVIIHSSSGQPLVVVRGGGKFPYYFSLKSENPHAPSAQFLVEPDTLL